MNINLNNLFKNSFVLTVDEERFNLFKKIFEYHGLPVPKKYEGFQFKYYYSYYAQKNRIKLGNNDIGQIKNMNTLNCSYGHASIIKFAQYLDFPFVCIFEDDAYPCYDIKNKLEYYLTDIPDDCECLILGNSGAIKTKNYNSKFCRLINYGYGTHAYMVFKNAYQKIIDNYNNNSAISDHVFLGLNNYSPIFNLFIQYNCKKSMNNHNSYTWLNYTQEQIFKGFPRIENIILQGIDLPENKNKNRFLKIVIPCYNCENTIRIMVNSILNQTCKDFFIVLVDDISTDNTFQILKEYEQKYPDYVKAVQVPEKAYADGAREFGFRQYNDAEFTWFVDADDQLTNGNAIQILKDIHHQKNYDLYTFGSDKYKFGFEYGKYCWAPWFRITRSDKVVFYSLHLPCCNDVMQTIMQFDQVSDEKIYHIDRVLYKYLGSHDIFGVKNNQEQKRIHNEQIEKIKNELKKISINKDYIKNRIKKEFRI